MPRLHGQVLPFLFLTSPPKFCAVWLVSGTHWEHWQGLSKDIPIPGNPVHWSTAPQASLDYLPTSFHIPLGSLHCPSSTFFAWFIVPIAVLPILFDRSLLYGLFHFAFLCSIYWELALIYIKLACADHQPSLFLYFQSIAQLTTLITVATAEDHFTQV